MTTILSYIQHSILSDIFLNLILFLIDSVPVINWGKTGFISGGIVSLFQ